MKSLSRFAISASLLLAVAVLPGCTDALQKFQRAGEVLTSASVSSKTVVLGIQSFDAAKVGATGMLRLRVCTAAVQNFCRPRLDDPDMVVMVKAIDEGTPLRDELTAWTKANPKGFRDQTSYEKLTKATGAIEKVIAAYNNVTK